MFHDTSFGSRVFNMSALQSFLSQQTKNLVELEPFEKQICTIALILT